MILRDLVPLFEMKFASSFLCWVSVSRVLHWHVLRKLIFSFACYYVLFVRNDQKTKTEQLTTTMLPVQSHGLLFDDKAVIFYRCSHLPDYNHVMQAISLQFIQLVSDVSGAPSSEL